MKILLNILMILFLLLPLSLAWSMEECPGSPHKGDDLSILKNWNKCYGISVLSNGTKFEGEFRNGKAHGQGILTMANGNKYEGEYRDGNYNGQGIAKYADGSKYVGRWKDGKPHGEGTFTNYKGAKNEQKYEGEFKYGKYHGQGILSWADGRVWVGKFEDSKWISGKKYAKGEYKGFDLAVSECPGSPQTWYNRSEINISKIKSWDNCKGTLISNSGEKYVGEFQDGLPSGQGSLSFANGDKYVGEIKRGAFDGLGTHTFANGNIYIGEYKDGKKHGQGKMTYSYGKYKGQWKNDKANGYGVFTYKKGLIAKKYEGQFKNGKRNGQGLMSYDDGYYSGQWKNDKEHGLGIRTNDNGTKYEGEFKNGKANGKGTFTFATGEILDGYWVDSVWRGKTYSDAIKNVDAVKRKKMKLDYVEQESSDHKEKMKLKKENFANDSEPPKIIIAFSNVEEKQGIIEGIVLDNIEVAELTIDGEMVTFDKDGNFTYSTYIPQNGKELVVQATDSKGLSKKKVIALKRKETSAKRIHNFKELNPLKFKGKKNENALALIIGVNNYLYAPEAKYADRDASYFADFLSNAMGIEKENIKTLSNAKATHTEIKIALKRWLKGYSIQDKSDIYIFFAGHGLASTDGKELYLLPYDGEPGLLEDTALLRTEVFNTVKSINPKSVTVFLDACYSGQTRDKDMLLAEARPISIVPVESDVPKNFTVFSASSGSEISGSLPEAEHGLFSYFLMKGLEGDADANNDKKITNGELHSYVRSNVTKQALRLGREQTPQLQGQESRVLVEFN